MWEIGSKIQLPSNKTLFTVFRLAYFHFTVTYSKRQHQEYAHFRLWIYWYIGNSDRYDKLTLAYSRRQDQCYFSIPKMVINMVKNEYRHQIAIHTWTFDWHIYIWRWTILKVKVKLMHIPCGNKATITVTIKYEIIYYYYVNSQIKLLLVKSISSLGRNCMSLFCFTTNTLADSTGTVLLAQFVIIMHNMNLHINNNQSKACKTEKLIFNRNVCAF